MSLLALVFMAASSLTPAEAARADALSDSLRCVVCQNQSIADSDAALARDMRDLVRQRVAAGDSDEEVRTYLVQRYGEYVLLRPKTNARNLPLWAGPGLALLIGAVVMYAFARKAKDVPFEEEEDA